MSTPPAKWHCECHRVDSSSIRVVPAGELDRRSVAGSERLIADAQAGAPASGTDRIDVPAALATGLRPHQVP